MLDDLALLCLGILDHYGLVLPLQHLYLLLLTDDFLLECGNLFDPPLPVLAGLEGLAHAKGHRAVVQGLVVGQQHAILVTHPHQKEPSLCTVDRDLPNHLIKDLLEELFTHLADAVFAGLLAMQFEI